MMFILGYILAAFAGYFVAGVAEHAIVGVCLYLSLFNLFKVLQE